MNCSSCQNLLEEYIAGQLAEDVHTRLKTHLESCISCQAALSALITMEKVIYNEKSKNSNPFLVTRVMVQIENKKSNLPLGIIALKKLWQPVSIVASIVLALTMGVLAGTSYTNTSTASTQIPEELEYMNDAQMESLNLLVTDN